MATVTLTDNTPTVISGDITFIQITAVPDTDGFAKGKIHVEATLDNAAGVYAPAMSPDGTPLEFGSDITFPVVTADATNGWRLTWRGRSAETPQVLVTYI